MTAQRRSKLAIPIFLLAIVGALLWWWRGSPTDGDATPPGNEDAAGSGREGGPTKVAGPSPTGGLGLLGDVGGAIAGRVTSSEGGPIAGADVCARTRDGDLGSAQTREPRCVKSEHDGSYRIEGLWRVEWTIGAAARGFVPASWDNAEEEDRGVRLDRDVERSGIDLVLEPGGVEVLGVVKDLGGGEIEGAFVSGSSGSFWGSATAWGAVARTDADGKFSLWIEEGDVNLQAQAEGYTSSNESGKAPGMAFTIVLTPESVLAGVVRDPEGKPVAGAMVQASGTEFFSANGSAISDDEGRYRIDQLGPGRYKPSARADGFEGIAKESVRLGIGESLDPVDVIVHPAALLVASVTIEGGGGPCPSGWLRLFDPKTQTRAGAAIEDGTAKVQAVRPGTYQVSLDCNHYAAADEYPDVEVKNEDVTDLAYEVKQGRSVRGVVVDADGKAVHDGRVFVQMKAGGRGTQRQSSDRTDESGRFEVDGLVAGTYTVNVWVTGQPNLIEPPEVVIPESGDPEEVRIVLDPSGGIRGTVRDAEGKPVAGIDVSASGSQTESTRVLDDGTFEIEGLRAGDYRVSARGSWWGDGLRTPGTHDDDVQGERVTVTEGDVAEVDLVVESRNGKITGTVVDEAGGPLADAYLAVTRESESATAAAGRAKQQTRWTWGADPILSDTDGRFVAENLADGKYTLRAFRKGGGEGFVEGVAVGESVEIRMEVEGSISGSVTIAGGAAPERFRVAVTDAAAGFRRNEEFAHTQGAWAIREVPAGTYEVVVSAAEGGAEQKEIALKAGEDREGIALVLEGRTTIRGRVVALDSGEPVEGVVVTASRRGGGYSFSFGQKRGKEVTAADGTYELENAPSGRLQLFTMPLNFTDFDTVGRGSIALEAEPGGVVDAPDILVPPRRVGRGQQAGDLGFETKQTEPGDETPNPPKVVALVRPGGPAAATDLKVGDVIVAVDGHDITGTNTGLYSLAQVTEGTTIELELERGATVRITAGPPL
jgi:hypothetical protein